MLKSNGYLVENLKTGESRFFPYFGNDFAQAKKDAFDLVEQINKTETAVSVHLIIFSTIATYAENGEDVTYN